MRLGMEAFQTHAGFGPLVTLILFRSPWCQWTLTPRIPLPHTFLSLAFRPLPPKAPALPQPEMHSACQPSVYKQPHLNDLPPVAWEDQYNIDICVPMGIHCQSGCRAWPLPDLMPLRLWVQPLSRCFFRNRRTTAQSQKSKTLAQTSMSLFS